MTFKKSLFFGFVALCLYLSYSLGFYSGCKAIVGNHEAQGKILSEQCDGMAASVGLVIYSLPELLP